MLRPAACAICLALTSPLPLRAAFVGNVEDFDGTTVDLSTWAEYRQYGNASFTQDGQLTIHASPGDIAELRSRYATIGVGGFAQVHVTMISDHDLGGTEFLALNTPPPPSFSFISSDRSVSLESTGDFAGFTTNQYHFPGTGGGDPFRPEVPFQFHQPYILRLDYLTPTTVQYQVFDPTMTLLGSSTLTLANLPDRFYITLGTRFADVVFDDLQIGGNASIPEPTSLFAACGLALPLLTRRRTKS